LAAPLRQGHLDFTLLDNAFTQIADWNQPQHLADQWRVEIHQKVDQFALLVGVSTFVVGLRLSLAGFAGTVLPASVYAG
jgi:hypothetical protein